MTDSDPSALLQAAQALDDELARFGRLVTAACRGELRSGKELERAARALQDATAVVGSIEQRAQALVRALQDTQRAQQAPIDRLRARAEELKRRHDEYEALRARFDALGADVAGLNELARPPDADAPGPLQIDLEAFGTLRGRLAQARTAARALVQDARAQSFEETAREAHGLEQMLTAVERRLGEAEAAARVRPAASS